MLTCPPIFSQKEKTGSADGEFRAEMPTTPGWHRIPGTELKALCPTDEAIQGATGCRSVIEAWNGGVADTKRDRLIFWGGGHSDYFGNEVYALDLRKGALSRLTDPSPVTNVNQCLESYTDGSPSARHTYGGLVYVPSQDAMFTFGGSKASCGSMSTAIWKFDAGLKTWTSMEPHHGDTLSQAPGFVADFDANSGMVFVSDRQNFLRYDPTSNTLKSVATLPETSYHLTGVIDAEHRLFLMAGYPGQFRAIEIGPHGKYGVHDWSHRVLGCDKLLNASFPGLAYDTDTKTVVAWLGGDSVIVFDAGKMSCQEQMYSGGPGPAQEAGTGGRFRYFPSLKAFAVVNDWKEDAYVLRLASGNPLPRQ